MSDWNNHPLSSEHNFTTEQLWHVGLSSYRESNPIDYAELININWEEFGVDYEGPFLGEEDNEVVAPETFIPLPVNQQRIIQNSLNDTENEDIFDLYIHIVNLVQTFN